MAGCDRRQTAITSDVTEFLDRAEPYLRQNALRNTVIATAVGNLLGAKPTVGEPSWFVSVFDDAGEVAGVAARSGRNDIYLGDIPVRSAGAVADAFAGAISTAGGVEGPSEVVWPFAERWCALRRIGYKQDYAVRLYRLGALHVPQVPGTARRATESDIAQLVAWTEAMQAEIGMSGPGLPIEALHRRIAAGWWWLWERDGRPVGLAAHQVPAYGWSRIGPVYTPPEERGRGYAAALSAHVSRILRAQGHDICLFADTDNATSNKIYRGIGFEPVREYVHYQFG
ncbi:GNAT family N-acetyltransferase [Nocardia sp. NPDC050712]|uniref:GNAT family N-acetyltransferase n=1 Tax=Nocardia sp. NPDC050712 TaxID=3155518 RepID=UPI0033E2EE78